LPEREREAVERWLDPSKDPDFEDLDEEEIALKKKMRQIQLGLGNHELAKMDIKDLLKTEIAPHAIENFTIRGKNAMVIESRTRGLKIRDGYKMQRDNDGAWTWSEEKLERAVGLVREMNGIEPEELDEELDEEVDDDGEDHGSL
jgi:hypothetical protein